MSVRIPIGPNLNLEALGKHVYQKATQYGKIIRRWTAEHPIATGVAIAGAEGAIQYRNVGSPGNAFFIGRHILRHYKKHKPGWGPYPIKFRKYYDVPQGLVVRDIRDPSTLPHSSFARKIYKQRKYKRSRCRYSTRKRKWICKKRTAFFN